jgi:hypothetical protein
VSSRGSIFAPFDGGDEAVDKSNTAGVAGLKKWPLHERRLAVAILLPFLFEGEKDEAG